MDREELHVLKGPSGQKQGHVGSRSLRHQHPYLPHQIPRAEMPHRLRVRPVIFYLSFITYSFLCIFNYLPSIIYLLLFIIHCLLGVSFIVYRFIIHYFTLSNMIHVDHLRFRVWWLTAPDTSTPISPTRSPGPNYRTACAFGSSFIVHLLFFTRIIIHRLLFMVD